MTDTTTAGAADLSTRARIRATAEELYVLRGHDGFSFGDIAEIIGVTRANIHHHFGNKQKLMSELIAGFAADAESRIAALWIEGDAPLVRRLAAQREDFARFYRRFNPPPESRNVWSPVSRLRLDLRALGQPAEEALARVNGAYSTHLRHALGQACRRGELVAAAPVDDLASLLRAFLLSCPPITQDTGSFAVIEHLFAALERGVLAAWRAA